ncbi:TPA: hypothetical protein U1C34_001455 [Streptococcus suis]|nr:hypothetical protein [Streptococcus suis]HEM3622658.1 hypothetical protein [Streptococcus suis]HEM3630914.1 hypothetical protein [Streptococcus suis]HEM3715161.1 hypothetical protein [Streptococcus suis]
MNKVKVIEEFYDEVEKCDRNVGNVFEVDDERLLVLSGENRYKKAFVEVVEGDENTIDYSKLQTDELRTLLTEKGIEFDKSTKKPDLIALLTTE